MEITSTSYAIADYCEMMKRNEIKINRDYQRNSKVWPDPARSFLIETILLHYSIPKLSLHQVTDLKLRKTYKDIVDGQQRSLAILDFYEDKLRISKRSEELFEARGMTYSELPEDLQQKFLNYALSVDLFMAANPDQIRQVFRRINSYTVPLNPEEKRHAVFQGCFKWFIYKLARRYDQALIDMGVFTDKQIIRMADTKLYSDITQSILKGIKTSSSSVLDKLYKEYDEKFDDEDEILSKIVLAFDILFSWTVLHKTELMKPHLVQALLLAIIHLKKPVPALQSVFESNKSMQISPQKALSILSKYADAIENFGDPPEDLKDLVSTARMTTNDGKRRAKLFKYMCEALV